MIIAAAQGTEKYPLPVFLCRDGYSLRINDAEA